MIKKDLKFDKEEKEILDAIEKDGLVSVPISKKEMKDLKLIAQNTFAKTKSINIRISQRDLLRLKARAAREGLPYQTFISSVLHKNTTNQA
jgi:predicted DNA binding CopG/RHH family protein